MKKYLIVLLIISSCTKVNSYKLPIYGRKVISEKIINGEKIIKGKTVFINQDKKKYTGCLKGNFSLFSTT